MKLKKQIALIIAMLLLPLAASADDSGSCGDNGDNVTYTYVEATQTLTISGTGAMNHYDSWSPKAPWNSYKSSIQTVIIEDGVTSIGSNAFYGCIVLSSITIPNSVTSIEVNAFYGCTGLSSVTIPNSVTSIGYKAFYDCLSLTSITIPNSVTSIGDYAFYNTTWYNSQSDGLLYLDNWLLGMKKIRPNGEIVIKDGTKGIAGGVFEYCSGLTSVTIPNSVTSIGEGAFYECHGLTSVTIPNSVTRIESGAFVYCSNLTSVSIGNSVTSIGESAFYETGWYNNQSNGLLYLDNWLLGYKGTQPSGELIIKEGTRGIANDAFNYCTGLTSVTIPNSVTSIGEYAFYACRGLTSVTIPNSVTSIGDHAFERCNLTSVTIPNSVTSIGDYAFNYCNLTSVTIGNSVKSIGDYAFGTYYVSGYNKLKEVRSMIKNPFVINSSVFQYDNEDYERVFTSATLYVPAGTKAKYQATKGWNNFKKIVEDAPVAVSGLTLNKSTISLRIGSSAKLLATVFPEDAANKDVTWSTSDKTVATVSADGTVKGIKEGTVTITCASVETPTILAQCTITVKDGIEGDLNGDDEVDVTDVVELIDMVLAGIYDKVGDINGDGEVDVTDVVELIDMVLSGE